MACVPPGMKSLTDRLTSKQLTSDSSWMSFCGSSFDMPLSAVGADTWKDDTNSLTLFTTPIPRHSFLTSSMDCAFEAENRKNAGRIKIIALNLGSILRWFREFKNQVRSSIGSTSENHDHLWFSKNKGWSSRFCAKYEMINPSKESMMKNINRRRPAPFLLPPCPSPGQ